MLVTLGSWGETLFFYLTCTYNNVSLLVDIFCIYCLLFEIITLSVKEYY